LQRRKGFIWIRGGRLTRLFYVKAGDFMSKTDTLEREQFFFTLDKPRLLKFTMKSVLTLEEMYGSLRGCIDKFISTSQGTDNDDDFGVRFAAVVALLQAGLDVSDVEGFLTVDKAVKAMMLIPKALDACFPGVDEGAERARRNPYEGWDWDELYFIARYRLGMTDGEFWGCTPRRFDKLYYMWLVDKGEIKEEEGLAVEY
jgi:hypothetical protein